jgi:CRISPR type III-B/RAMP module-associated protein Cmr5
MSFERTISSLALKLTDEIKATYANNSDAQSDYRSFSQSFPILLRSAGLNQTLAFLKGKDKELHRSVYAHYEAHFRALKLLEANSSLLELSGDATKLPAGTYRLYNRIALQIAYWHKRFAEARLPKRKKEA